MTTPFINSKTGHMIKAVLQGVGEQLIARGGERMNSAGHKWRALIHPSAWQGMQQPSVRPSLNFSLISPASTIACKTIEMRCEFMVSDVGIH
jgi:hypothetical protein